jgi:gluconolactonase
MLIKYSGKNKFIFVANTKCASTSIEHSKIAEISDIKLSYGRARIGRHMSIDDIYEKFNFVFEEFKFNEFFKFGVIRDPLDWVVSWFNFTSRPELRDPKHRYHKNYTGEMTFTEFWHLKKNTGFLKLPQNNMFFSIKSESIRVDYLARQEKLLEDFSLIQDILGLDSLKIPKINESSVRRINPNDVEDSFKEEIREKYRSDYDLIEHLESFNSKGLEFFKHRIVTSNIEIINRQPIRLIFDKECSTQENKEVFIKMTEQSSTSSSKKLCQDNLDPHFQPYSKEFCEVLGPNPEFTKLVETDAHEGSVYVKKWNAVVFTTVPQSINIPLPNYKNVAIKKLSLNDKKVSVVRESSNMANGMTLDCNGDLLICEQGTKSTPARISRLDLNNPECTKTIVQEWFGLPFNSPNDIVVKRDGTIWFTDPSYGFLQKFKDAPLVGDFVYRYDPETNFLSVVADSFNKPNGLAFSPKEDVLYITDSGAIQEPGSYHVELPHHIRAFDVKDSRYLVNDRLFAVVTPGIPDGIKVDTEGRVYTSSADSVQVFNNKGDLIGKILVDGVANFTFGGPDNNILYMMADTAIYAATLEAKGAKPNLDV